MTDILLGLASLAPVTLAGWLVLTALDAQRALRPIEKLSLGYGIGTGLLVWETLVFHSLGLSLTAVRILGPLIIAAVLALVFARRCWPRDRGSQAPFISERVPFQALEWFLIAAVAAEISAAFFQAWLLPMEAYDAVSNWGLKAKAIFLAGEIPLSFLRNPNYEVFHPDYPLLVPLIESHVYRFLGDLREASAKVIFPLFLAGCTAVLFAVLRKAGQTRRSGLLFSFLLTSIPYFSQQATNGYADVVMSFYFGGGTLYLYLWQTTGNGLFLALSALLTACAALTKNEGLVIVGVHLLWLAGVLLSRAGTARRRKLISFGTYFCILAAVLTPWYLFKVSLGVGNDVINSEAFRAGFSWKSWSRMGPIAYHLQTQVFGPKNWNLVWILLCAAVVVRRQVLLRSPAVLVLCVMGLVLAAYMSVYLVTPYTTAPFDVRWHLRTSASRLLLHALPHAVFLIGLAFGEAEKPGERPYCYRTP